MKPAFKILFCFAVTPIFLSFPAAQELTEKEEAAAQACKGNITQGLYSPDSAESCLKALHDDNDALLEKLRSKDPRGTAFILKYNAIFRELGGFYADEPNQCYIRKKLALLFDVDRQENACALCELGLGPQPEKILPWVDKHAQDYTRKTAQAAFLWETLPTQRRDSLAAQGYSQNAWKEKTLYQKIAALIADDILTSADPDYLSTEETDCFIIEKPVSDNLSVFLNDNLDPGMLARYSADRDRFFARIGKLKTAEKARSPKDCAGTDKMAGKLKNSASEADKAAALGNIFDGSNTGGARSSGRQASLFGGLFGCAFAKTLTDAQAAQVADKLVVTLLGRNPDGTYSGGELKGTSVGDRLLSMYNQKKENGTTDTPLVLKVVKFGPAREDLDGLYCFEESKEGCGEIAAGEMALNKTALEKWMTDKGISAEKLLDPKNSKYLKKLARRFAPLVVHEATHQQDDKWSRGESFPYNYNLAHEVEAYASQAIFLKEKLSIPDAAPLYQDDHGEFDAQLIQKLENGGYRELKKFVRFYKVHDITGQSSRSFTQFENALKELDLREPGTETAPPPGNAGCWIGEPQKCSSEKLRGLIDRVYPWYRQAVQKQGAEVAFINSEMNRLAGTPSTSGYRSF